MTSQTLSPPAQAPAGGRTRRRGAAHEAHQTRPAWLFLLPFMALYLLFIIGPTIYGFVMSFFNTSLVHSGLGSGAGVSNFREILQSRAFWQSVWHTVEFTIYTTIPLVLLGFVLALLANRVRRGKWFFRLAFFIPYMLPSATIALVWQFIYTPDLGVLSTVLSKLGVDKPPAWLGDPHWAMISVAIATIWWTLGFNFVLYLAGLQEIPRELYEAAAIDGASPWQQIRQITIPLLSRTTTLVIVLQIIASLKVFDQIFIMTSGGPGTSTTPALEFIYNTAFSDFRVGAAAAASMIFFLLILLVSAVWMAITRRQERQA
jgi:multiple sugar transport system permease protein